MAKSCKCRIIWYYQNLITNSKKFLLLPIKILHTFYRDILIQMNIICTLSATNSQYLTNYQEMLIFHLSQMKSNHQLGRSKFPVCTFAVLPVLALIAKHIKSAGIVASYSSITQRSFHILVVMNQPASKRQKQGLLGMNCSKSSSI